MVNPEKRLPRYGIGGLLLLTLVFAIMGAAGRQFVLSVNKGTSPRAPFVIFTLAAPMIFVAVLGTVLHLLNWLKRIQRK
jgi:hypothetical protein